MCNRVAQALPILISAFVPSLFAQMPCASLAQVKLEHAEITSSVAMDEGPLPGTGKMPALCIVKAVAKPTSDSQIGFQVWLPLTNWNGKFEQVGNGGWAGTIPASAMIDPLRRGYATAGTDDGHQGNNDASWAVGHPEKLIDFGYRAVHETSLQAHALIRAFYGKEPSRSYFVGCSEGGREALLEAQRYPNEFDGIIAGAPANYWSHLFAGFVWNEQALLMDPASRIPPFKLLVIQKAVLTACDALDGVKDGLLEDPRQCHFNPRELLCKEPNGQDCLTGPQIDALQKIYAGPSNPRTGARIFPGYPPGTESVTGTWDAWIIPPTPRGGSIQGSFGNSFYGQAVFEKPVWDFRTLNFDTDVALADQKAGAILNSTNVDLRPFQAHGGKLIQYHGWGDAAISPLNSIDYYESVRSFLAKNGSAQPVQDFYRLFMVPGMGHCGGGIGATSFGNTQGTASISTDPERDVLSALERWVEKGASPEHLIASGTVAGNASKRMTRPLCPYPQVAKYNGSGDSNDASNFVCGAN
jgi:feruloyl esterase